MADIITPVEPLYCGACGMPPEYCEFGPDFETHCNPWLLKSHPDVHAKLKALRGKPASSDKKKDAFDEDGDDAAAASDSEDDGPTEPWTTEERLTAFYEQYQPDKVGDVPKLLEKYDGKYDKLFTALVKKYGPEPEDPYITANYASDSDDSDDDGEGKMSGLSLEEKKARSKKRRGVGAKKVNKVDTRVIIQKIRRQRRKAVTIVVGMDTVPGVKLKDVSKEFRIKFAGSSSVKDTAGGGKEIVIQGDHTDAAAALIIKKFKVPADAVFLDIDGEFVPFAG
mmetsp:Transcript_32975/g.72729  ORF Transcript_32975/g.72729 Transcript_32975/m.72729 type:complete len:281 (+) Transcript_32975:82-924(+)